MSYEKKPDRSQVYLLPPSLEEWIDPQHPARFIDAFVGSLDLPGMGFKVGHAPVGRPSYSAQLLLAVFVYCYFNRIRTYRGMEQACVENVAVMWLTGNEHPDHNTLWRFYRDNKGAIRKVLKQSVRVAARSNLVGMVLHAVDGTKIQAQASCKTAKHRKVLEKVLERTEASIAEMEASLESSEEGEAEGYRLPAELADAEARRERIRESLAELEREGTDSLQSSEPEARIMLCDGRKVFGYNAQAVTDAKAGIIVAEQVVTQPNDIGLLAPMIDTVKDMIGEVATTTLADKGYSSGEDLAQAEDRGYEVLVNLPRNVDPAEGDKPFHASRFTYDGDQDCCVCPLGNNLTFRSTKKDRRGSGLLRVYKCTTYRDCPKRWQCSSAKRGRTIGLTQHHAAVTRQRDKVGHPEARTKLARRCVIAEPSFATAKHVLGFRRWSYRDLESNRTQWSLICTTVNLLKLYTAWLNGQVVFTTPTPASSSSLLSCFCHAVAGFLGVALSPAGRPRTNSAFPYALTLGG